MPRGPVIEAPVGLEAARQRRRPNESGFSLLEAIVALTLLVIGMMPLAHALVSTNNSREDAERVYRMHLLAANQLEAVKLQGETVTQLIQNYAIDDSFPIAATELAGLAGSAEGRVEVSRLSATGTAALVQVHIDYIDANGAPRRETVATIIRKGGA
ncbi:MAG: prepilin-type N-terminal cleavage/methylation domain-containing protein [Planctomycetota bacterium]